MNTILTRLTLNAAIVAILVAALVVQTVRIEGLKIPLVVWSITHTGYKARVANLKATLTAITDKRNEQRNTTKRNVDSAEREIIRVETVIRPLESKPIGENPRCETPDLEAWRGVL